MLLSFGITNTVFGDSVPPTVGSYDLIHSTSDTSHSIRVTLFGVSDDVGVALTQWDVWKDDVQMVAGAYGNNSGRGNVVLRCTDYWRGNL